MKQIKSEIKNESALLEKFGADERYNTPGSYSNQQSFFGNGKYPPDWAQRRNAIWWLQDDRCARCGRSHNNEGHVHHIRPLAKNGDNTLDNLVGLCADCHALLHPRVTDLNGDWQRAPKYPCEGAEPDVAVIKRSPATPTEKKVGAESDFEKLAQETVPKENYYATQSLAVYEASSDVALQLAQDSTHDPTENHIRAVEELNRLLLLRGRVPENNTYRNRRLEVETPVSGLRGWLSTFEPTVTVKPEGKNESGTPGTVTEETAPGEFVFSADVSAATVTVTDGAGDTSRENVSFTDEQTAQSVSIPVSPPPTSEVGHYFWSTLKKSRLLTIASALLWLLVVPITGLVLLVSLFSSVFGALGTVGWLVISVFFGGSWTMVGQLLLATVVSFVVSGFAILILEQFGIDLSE